MAHMASVTLRLRVLQCFLGSSGLAGYPRLKNVDLLRVQALARNESRLRLGVLPSFRVQEIEPGLGLKKLDKLGISDLRIDQLP